MRFLPSAALPWALAAGALALIVLILLGKIWQQRRQLRALRAPGVVTPTLPDQPPLPAEQWLATLSHELRTPLVAIDGHITLLLENLAFDPSTRHRLETIQDASGNLVEILDGLLTLACSEAIGNAAGRVLPQTTFDLAALVSRSVDVLRPQAHAKQLRIDLDIQLPQPYWVTGSALALRQVLYNLLSNAIKFTEHGGVAISLLPTLRGEGFRLQVSDTGTGIPAHYQGSMFDAFSRLQPHGQPGVGLGLYIVQRLASLIGGRISLDSHPGVGSRFALSLPWPQQPVPNLSPSLEVPLQGVFVLLVEDVAVSREVTRELLLSWGCLVETAADGTRAIELCRQQDFDVVLMDLRLPDMDGVDACRIIRNASCADTDPALAPGPLIVALTADAFDLPLQAAARDGLDGLLTKPLTRGALQGVLSGERLFGPGPGPEAVSATLALNAAGMQALRDWLGNDVFERLLPTLVDSLRQVRKALAHDSHLHTPALLHRLQGSAANFGLHKLAQDARATVRGQLPMDDLLLSLDQHLHVLETDMTYSA